MGLSTQRLLVYLIAVNLLIGLAGEIYYNPDATVTMIRSVTGSEISIQEDYSTDFRSVDDDFNPASDSQQFGDTTVGDPIGMGLILFRVLVRGFNPLPFLNTNFTSLPEIVVAVALTLFRGYMYVIGILEFYFIIKNRKTT